MSRFTARAAGIAGLLLPAALGLFAFVIPVRGIDQHFWLLGDQIRDWGIALRPFRGAPPEYRPLVAASRAIVAAHPTIRSIRTAFVLPPSTDAEFVYRILGGRVDARASWAAVVQADGGVRYQPAGELRGN